MLPRFTLTFYRHFHEDENMLSNLYLLEDKIEHVISVYNQQASYQFSHRDETGLVLNGYLREIIKDVTGYDIGMRFHKFHRHFHHPNLWCWKYI